jgi:hypothetical protein
MYNELVTAKYVLPVLFISNSLYYWFMRVKVGVARKFSHLGRTILFGYLYNHNKSRYFPPKGLMDNYKVNINDLFDRDEAFLYENREFRGLVRRIHNKFPHLLNDKFKIDESILAPDKEIDERYEKFDVQNK